MKTFLSIDAGNTNPHIGYFSNGQLKSTTPFYLFNQFEKNFKYSIANVSNLNLAQKFKQYGEEVKLNHHFKNNIFIDMPVHYEESLGEDRLYQAYFLYSYYLKNNAIILIDSGTFTTIDLITNNGFKGGFILPGITSYFSNISNGANLPPLEYSTYKISNQSLPQTTQEALSSGLDFMYSNSILNIINRTSNIKIILTGSKIEIIEIILRKYFPKIPFQKEIDLIHHSIYHCANKVNSVVGL